MIKKRHERVIIMDNVQIIDVTTKGTMLLYASAKISDQKNVKAKLVAKGSPIDTGTVLITVVAPKGNEDKVVRLIRESIVLRKALPADVRKKMIMISGDPSDTVSVQWLTQKEMGNAGVSSLFQEDGKSVTEKMSYTQYILEISAPMNEKATVRLYSMREGIVLSLPTVSYEDAAGNILDYLLSGEADGGAPTVEERASARKELERLNAERFYKVWDMYLKDTQKRQAAYQFLLTNYAGSDRLNQYVASLLYDGERTGDGKKLELGQLVNLLAVSRNSGNASSTDDILLDVLRAQFKDKPMRDLIMDKLGIRDIYDDLTKFNDNVGDKNIERDELISNYCTTPERTERFGRTVWFMASLNQLHYERVVDLYDHIIIGDNALIIAAYEHGMHVIPRMSVLSQNTSISEDTVTHWQFKFLMGYTPVHLYDNYLGMVNKITWEEAVEYCARLSVQEGVASREQKAFIEQLLRTVADFGRDSEEYRTAMKAYISYALSKDGQGLYRLPTMLELAETQKKGTALMQKNGTVEWCADSYISKFERNYPDKDQQQIEDSLSDDPRNEKGFARYTVFDVPSEFLKLLCLFRVVRNK